MESQPHSANREDSSPFLLKLFHRIGTFHRPDEFLSARHLPSYTAIYAWPTTTLKELTHLLAVASPSALPSPAIGTRVAYRLLYHDTRGNPSAPRLATQELGSVIIGDGGQGVISDEIDADIDMSSATWNDEGLLNDGTLSPARPTSMIGSEAEAKKTLVDARFVVGDFMSVAILPPSTVDGSVQPVPATRTGWAVQARNSSGNGDFGGSGSVGMSLGRDGRQGRRASGAGMAREQRRPRDHAVPPMGEWRRGERLPDVPPSRGRGRRRW